ncbi:hypothetical protein BDZ45DRAFT_807817 [Acephala macrosclerotiorum]|nr:hypothetical protein BDZ45DRAFT_807817 [Acephala macrosclerotiorum]
MARAADITEALPNARCARIKSTFAILLELAHSWTESSQNFTKLQFFIRQFDNSCQSSEIRVISSSRTIARLAQLKATSNTPNATPFRKSYSTTKNEPPPANRDSFDSKSRYLRDWEWLSHQESDGSFSDQLKLVLRICTVLKDYSQNPQLNRQFSLLGSDSNWTSAADLLSLRRRAESGTFSKWVSEKLLPYHHNLGRFIHKKTPDQYNEVKYKDSAVLKTVSMIATTLAAMLIIAPVAILYKISSMEVRLEVMAAFIVLFSLCITKLTNAKRGEVFAATAA